MRERAPSPPSLSHIPPSAKRARAFPPSTSRHAPAAGVASEAAAGADEQVAAKAVGAAAGTAVGAAAKPPPSHAPLKNLGLQGPKRSYAFAPLVRRAPPAAAAAASPAAAAAVAPQALGLVAPAVATKAPAPAAYGDLRMTDFSRVCVLPPPLQN